MGRLVISERVELVVRRGAPSRRGGNDVRRRHPDRGRASPAACTRTPDLPLGQSAARLPAHLLLGIRLLRVPALAMEGTERLEVVGIVVVVVGANAGRVVLLLDLVV